MPNGLAAHSSPGIPPELEEALSAVSRKAEALADVAAEHGLEVSNALVDIALDDIREEIQNQLEEDPA